MWLKKNLLFRLKVLELRLSRTHSFLWHMVSLLQQKCKIFLRAASVLMTHDISLNKICITWSSFHFYFLPQFIFRDIWRKNSMLYQRGEWNVQFLLCMHVCSVHEHTCIRPEILKYRFFFFTENVSFEVLKILRRKKLIKKNIWL